MQTTTTIPVADVKPGQIVRNAGYDWLVTANHFDPIGNGSQQAPSPRYLIKCKSAVPEQAARMGPGYAESMSLGYLESAHAMIVLPA